MTAVAPELAIYLNDHLAGSTAGTRLADRVAGALAGTPSEIEARELAEQIHEDADALRRIIDALGVHPQTFKRVLAAVSETASRIKLGAAGGGNAHLSHVLQLESLTLGVTGKHRLWLVLRQAAGPRIATDDVDELVRRAEQQLGTIERLRAAEAKAAFGVVPVA
jgi:hypothetical protein